jgi:hypothetical protein
MDAIAVTTATDLFEFTTITADRPIIVHELTLCQTTDLQDAAEEVLRIGLYRGATAGSTGTAATEVAYNHSDNGTVTGVINMVRGTASTGGTLLEIIGWNIRVPLLWCPTPELRPRFDAGEDPFTFRLLSAPTDSITVSGTLKWEEF